MFKPILQTGLSTLAWMQQKPCWSSRGGGLSCWLCEFTLSDRSSLGTDSLPGSPGAGFLSYESHLKNACLLIPAVSRGWAISLLSMSVPPFL